MFTREVSVLRALVPFKFHAAGPVAEMARRTLERHPHYFAQMLERLEELDTNPYPKVLMAESLQALMSGAVQQRDLRKMFFAAESEANAEASGKFDAERVAVDPEYKLNTVQLAMGAGWWARMFLVHHEPWLEAEEFIHMRYASDVRRDETISQYTRLMLEESGRAQINDDMEQLYHELFILERDLYGQFRFDKRADQVFMLQSVRLSEVGRNDESAVSLLGGIRAVGEVGHFDVETTQIQDRWLQYMVRCKPETTPAPWWERVEVPEARVAAPTNLRIGPAIPMAAGGTTIDSTLKPQPVAVDAEEDEEGATRESHEFLNTGYIKVHFDSPIVPRRTSRNESEFKFELAVVRDEVGFLPRKVGREFGV